MIIPRNTLLCTFVGATMCDAEWHFFENIFLGILFVSLFLLLIGFVLEDLNGSLLAKRFGNLLKDQLRNHPILF